MLSSVSCESFSEISVTSPQRTAEELRVQQDVKMGAVKNLEAFKVSFWSDPYKSEQDTGLYIFNQSKWQSYGWNLQRI